MTGGSDSRLYGLLVLFLSTLADAVPHYHMAVAPYANMSASLSSSVPLYNHSVPLSSGISSSTSVAIPLSVSNSSFSASSSVTSSSVPYIGSSSSTSAASSLPGYTSTSASFPNSLLSSSASSSPSSTPALSIPRNTSLPFPFFSRSSSSTPGQPLTLSTTGPGFPLNPTVSSAGPSLTIVPPAFITVPTTIDGTLTTLFAISGEDVTSPAFLYPTLTIAPTGTTASSIEASLQTQINDVVPDVEDWLKNTKQDIDPVIDKLVDTENVAEDLLSDIAHDSDHDTHKGCTHSLFSILSCIVDKISKIRTSIADDVIDDVEDDLSELKDLAEHLPALENDNNKKSSSSASSSSPTEVSSTSQTTSASSCSFHYVNPTVTGCSASISSTTATSTSSSSSSSAPFLCEQTGCEICTNPPPLPKPTVACKDCTTINGVAYPPQKTSVPAGLTVGSDTVSLPSAGATAQKRSQSLLQQIPELAGRDKVELKRTLPDPAYYPTGDALLSYLQFWFTQLNDEALLRVPFRPAGTGGSSSALVRGFFSNERLYMSVQGLWGCTSVILISQSAVYMSHLFEAPGFTETFQQDILDALPNGDPTPINIGERYDGEPWLPNLNELSQPGRQFDRNQPGGVRAIIVTPKPMIGNPDELRYPEKIDQIREWLVNTFDNDPLLYAYTTTNQAISEGQVSTEGKILVQYDPSEFTTSETILVNGMNMDCPYTVSGVKVWVGMEENGGNLVDPFYSNFWRTGITPQDEPLPVGGGVMLARDGIPNACVLKGDNSTSSMPSLSHSTSAQIFPSSILSTPSSLTSSVFGNSSTLIPSTTSTLVNSTTTPPPPPPPSSTSSTSESPPPPPAPTTTTIPPPSTSIAPPPVITSPLTVGSVNCFSANSFPGHGDIAVAAQDNFAVQLCAILASSSTTLHPPVPTGGLLVPGASGIESTSADEHGINYSYMIQWIEGCTTTVSGQDVSNPTGSEDESCAGLLSGNYNGCVNTGVGGWTQAGCLNYSFQGGLGEPPACYNCATFNWMGGWIS